MVQVDHGGMRRKQNRYAKQGRRRTIPSDSAHRAAETIAGICLVAASLCYLLAPFVVSKVQGSDYFLAYVYVHIGAWYISYAALLVGSLLLVLAVLALVYLLSDRRGVYALVGGALALFGILASTVTTTILLVIGQIAQMNDPAAMEPLLYRIVAVWAPFHTLIVLLWLGMLVLTTGLYQRGAAPGWSIVLLVIGTVLRFLPLPSFFSLFLSMVAIALLGFALLLGRRTTAPRRLKGNLQNVRSKTLSRGTIQHR